jgi:small acid-soluble spore protein D (minor alpha/beta-type SASP)
MNTFYSSFSSVTVKKQQKPRRKLPLIFVPRKITIIVQTQSRNSFPKTLKECKFTMASNKIVVPQAREALDRFKMEAANEVGVNLKQGYNGDLTSKQAGSVGGQMVKKMIEAYENSVK